MNGKFNLIYDKVVIQNKDLAYAYFTMSFIKSGNDVKTPGITLRLINGNWQIDGFANYFFADCVVEDCKQWAHDRFYLGWVQKCFEDYSGALTYSQCESSVTNAYFTDMESHLTCDKSSFYGCKYT